ncbi:MetQ/NlpA family ABC transporter substrate-binding protein [Chlamydia sp. 17-3921]|uniref:MetQ/NlpA family ABC transporter substrate-binding protein n=1 Tax=Chlamydia sp. 17-3921 TaxID=2675798 RepID=UPI001917F4DC|nr:MetQ/NlpA family ABC transporter substrate-binding protein [Chlamydia sp. 17-3921]
MSFFQKFGGTVLFLSLLLGSCHNQGSQDLIRIAASPTPHAELLYFLEKEAQDLGLRLKILPVDDYRIPNRLLLDKQIEANYFQHEDFFLDECKHYRCLDDLIPLIKVHLEPMGLYSKKFATINDLKNETKLTIAIPVDRTNAQRALDLLKTCELVSFKQSSFLNATARDVCPRNGMKISIREIAAPLLMSSLPDVDAAIIPGNFAISGGLSPQKDSLFLEDITSSKYANIVVVRREDLNTIPIQKLKQLLQSDRVKDFFESRYQGNILTLTSS